MVRKLLLAAAAGVAAAAAVARNRRGKDEDVWGEATRVVDLR